MSDPVEYLNHLHSTEDKLRAEIERHKKNEELQMERAIRAEAEVKLMRDERDIWRARAFAMFWKLPGDLTVGELQDDAERARTFIQADTK